MTAGSFGTAGADNLRLGMPILTWTVRSEAERARVLDYADQVIFEGFTPHE